MMRIAQLILADLGFMAISNLII